MMLMLFFIIYLCAANSFLLYSIPFARNNVNSTKPFNDFHEYGDFINSRMINDIEDFGKYINSTKYKIIDEGCKKK